MNSDDPWGDASRDSADEYPVNREGPHDDLGTYDPSGEHPQEAPGVGMGVRILIGLILLGGLAAMLCCGVGAYVLSLSSITDPVAVREEADRIARVELPERFEPRGGFVYPPPSGLTGWMPGSVRVAIFTDVKGSGVIKLSRVVQDEGAPAADLRRFEQTFDQDPELGLAGVDVMESEDRTVRLASGQEATFNFALARSRDDDTEYRQVGGRIRVTPNDTISLTFQGPEAEYDEAEVLAILESIEIE